MFRPQPPNPQGRSGPTTAMNYTSELQQFDHGHLGGHTRFSYPLDTNDVHHQLGLADFAQLHAYAEPASYSNVSLHDHNLARMDLFATPAIDSEYGYQGSHGTFKITRIIPISQPSLHNCDYIT